MTGSDETVEWDVHHHAVEGERQQLMLEVVRLQGYVAALRDQVAALEAAQEHHRGDAETARLEAADARAAQQADQVRVEESRRLVAELRRQLDVADEQRKRAESERAAVIAALGRKARRLVEDPTGP